MAKVELYGFIFLRDIILQGKTAMVGHCSVNL